jgi:hypothetical protein
MGKLRIRNGNGGSVAIVCPPGITNDIEFEFTITDDGDGSMFLANDGTYKSVNNLNKIDMLLNLLVDNNILTESDAQLVKDA